MTTETTRLARERGTGQENVQVLVRVPPSIRDSIATLAKNMGLSRSQAFEQIIAHLEINEEGVPAWYSPDSDQEELFHQREARAS